MFTFIKYIIIIGAFIYFLPVIILYYIIKWIIISVSNNKKTQIKSEKQGLFDKIHLFFFGIYENRYYKSAEFLIIKSRIQNYIFECNQLSKYISNLKNTRAGYDNLEKGVASYCDNSLYQYSRPEYSQHTYSENVYNCSRSVCDGARMQPFKYLCKYFGISLSEKSLESFENLLNNFESARDGEKYLEQEKQKILDSIKSDIPYKIFCYGIDRLQSELGFQEFSFPGIDFPRYIFQYVSPGGNASAKCEIVLDFENLNRFILYLSEKIKFINSVQGQRALMTSSLRRKILERDNFTCKHCKNSIYLEPNLLLEIDHITPLSKGGITTEGNLQVLCWKCNRSKGNKIIN